ncbi:MAG: zf-TFIIB domain-containing protein [Candidatus Omnitrophota bacterium]
MANIECPKCNVTMTTIRLNGAETDECPDCGGIWVDHFEEKQVLEMMPEVFTIEELQNLRKVYKSECRTETIKYVRCPRCGDFMWRKNYMHHSGIIVDTCKKCGTFFDKGELEKAVDFIKKGGIEYEKMKRSERAIVNVQSKMLRELTRVENKVHRLHWVGRILSLLGL